MRLAIDGTLDRTKAANATRLKARKGGLSPRRRKLLPGQFGAVRTPRPTRRACLGFAELVPPMEWKVRYWLLERKYRRCFSLILMPSFSITCSMSSQSRRRSLRTWFRSR